MIAEPVDVGVPVMGLGMQVPAGKLELGCTQGWRLKLG